MPDRDAEDYTADELAAVFDVVHEVQDEVASEPERGRAEREALDRIARATHFARDLALREEFPPLTQKLFVRVADDVERIEAPPDPRPWTEYEPPEGPRAADADVDTEGDLPDRDPDETEGESEGTRLADGLDPVFDHLDAAREAVTNRDWATVDPDEVTDAVDRVERATHYARDLALQREMADGPTPNQKLWATVTGEEIEQPPHPGAWAEYEPPSGRETAERDVETGTEPDGENEGLSR